MLKGHIIGAAILSSAPSYWKHEAVEYAKQFDVPDLTKELPDLIQNPCQEMFDIALAACMSYYFHKDYLKEGSEYLLSMPFNYKAAVWWQNYAVNSLYDTKWVPDVPTLILGGEYDCICTFKMFREDSCFNQPHVELVYCEKAGHAPWFEQPAQVREAFERFQERVIAASEL